MRCLKCNQSVFDVTVSIIGSYMKKADYQSALNTLRWAESAFGKCSDLTCIHIFLLLDINSKHRSVSPYGLSLQSKFNDHKVLKEAVNLFNEVNDGKTKELPVIRSRLVNELVNSAVCHVKENNPVIPYGACGDLVYEARSQYRRATHEALELIGYAIELDPINKDIIIVREKLLKIISN